MPSEIFRSRVRPLSRLLSHVMSRKWIQSMGPVLCRVFHGQVGRQVASRFRSHTDSPLAGFCIDSLVFNCHERWLRMGSSGDSDSLFFGGLLRECAWMR